MNQDLPFIQVKKVRLYEEVAEQIKKAIFDGKLKPGDRLPSERELCKIFGVGRPALREALRTLNVLGLIEVNTGVRGSFVKGVDITQYMEAVREELAHLIQVEEETVADLLQVRRYMQAGLVRAAAQKATPDDFEELDRLIKEMEGCGDDVYSYFPVAIEFHRKLALATKSKVYYLFWKIFEDILHKAYTLEKLLPQDTKKLIELNKILLGAIKSGDVAAVDKAVALHKEEDKFFSDLLKDLGPEARKQLK